MKRVYVATPLKLEKFPFEKIQRTLLQMGVFAFVPLPQSALDKDLVIHLNRHHIELSDEVWVFGKYGRDVAWEIGYAQGLGKMVRIFKTDANQQNVTDDEMMFCLPIEIIGEDK